MMKREAVGLYDKVAAEQICDDFIVSEFKCGCETERCTYTLLHRRLVLALQALREEIGMPMHVTSGFRCQTHNEVVGGARNSYHTKGMAADFYCGDLENVYGLITSVPKFKSAFRGVGYYHNQKFIHVDVRDTEHQIIWVR